MKAKEIFMQTLPFCWMKLGLGVLNIVICAVLFAILMGISLLFASEGVFFIMFLIWLGLIGGVNFFINHYVGYLVRAGHIAVVAETFKTGRVPSNCVAVGKDMVKKRFATSNAYFALDKLVGGAIKQLQRTLGRITDSLLGSLPGADSVKSATNFFLDISLGYIDECCLAYTFYKDEQNAYKSACDGVVIYAQNWKALLKNSAMTALTVIVTMLVVTLVAFVTFGGLFKILGWNGFVAFVLAVMLAATIKYAFVDSWMTIKMMHGYMEVAPSTQITFDLYSKLSNLSGKFKQLFKQSAVTPATANAASSPDNSYVAPQQPAPQKRFCPQCGSPIGVDKAFCGNCGVKM